MNKMAKGAVATAAGVVLLIGGGGTLAVWNVETNSKAGTVASGDLNLTTSNGKWVVNGGTEAIDITTYRVVPGDMLTYTEEVDITVQGNNLAADLSIVSPSGTNVDFGDHYTVTPVTLKKGGVTVPARLTDDVQDAVASVSFEFRADTTGRGSVNASYNLGAIAFKLDQVAP